MTNKNNMWTDETQNAWMKEIQATRTLIDKTREICYRNEENSEIFKSAKSILSTLHALNQKHLNNFNKYNQINYEAQSSLAVHAIAKEMLDDSSYFANTFKGLNDDVSFIMAYEEKQKIYENSFKGKLLNKIDSVRAKLFKEKMPHEEKNNNQKPL